MTMGRRCKFSGEKAAGGTSAARHPGEANKGGPWPDGPLGDGAIPPPFARPGGMKMGDSFHGFGDGGGAKSDPGQGKRRIRITRACPKVQAGHVLAPTMESSDADGVARCVPKLCERCERASERGWSPSGLVITNPTMHGPLSYQKAEMPPLGSLPARL